MGKKMVLSEAISLVKDGATIGLGGNVLHRSPMAFVREIVRHSKKDLTLVKTAGAHDIDLLCAGGCVSSVHAGFVSYESKYGLATHYRKGVQTGAIKGHEHACYTVISALRAAQAGVPFMPVKGLNTGDLLEVNDYFLVVEDPFGGEPVTLVKSIVPDVCIVHVHECDEDGNAVIHGPKYEDVLMSRASEKVIITTEQIVSRTKMKLQMERVDIPGFLVDAIVHIPKGASPTSCHKKYSADEVVLSNFIQSSTQEGLQDYLNRYVKQDHSGGRVTYKV